MLDVDTVTLGDLREHGSDVIDRVEAGECLIVSRDGRPVAQLRPLSRRPVDLEALRERWRDLPPVDPAALRRDIDSIIDPSL